MWIHTSRRWYGFCNFSSCRFSLHESIRCMIKKIWIKFQIAILKFLRFILSIFDNGKKQFVNIVAFINFFFFGTHFCYFYFYTAVTVAATQGNFSNYLQFLTFASWVKTSFRKCQFVLLNISNTKCLLFLLPNNIYTFCIFCVG